MRLIENFKDAFRNRGMSSYAGLKIAGLVVLVAIFIFIISLIFKETLFASTITSNATALLQKAHSLIA